jgi:hypothetical protein
MMSWFLEYTAYFGGACIGGAAGLMSRTTSVCAGAPAKTASELVRECTLAVRKQRRELQNAATKIQREEKKAATELTAHVNKGVGRNQQEIYAKAYVIRAARRELAHVHKCDASLQGMEQELRLQSRAARRNALVIDTARMTQLFNEMHPPAQFMEMMRTLGSQMAAAKLVDDSISSMFADSTADADVDEDLEATNEQLEDIVNQVISGKQVAPAAATTTTTKGSKLAQFSALPDDDTDLDVDIEAEVPVAPMAAKMKSRVDALRS